MSDRSDEAPELTHVDQRGRAHMVDVSAKAHTERVAVARAIVELTPAVRRALFAGELPKGEAIAVARVAGIQAAKETSRLIPMCHPLSLTAVAIAIEPSGESDVVVSADVRCTGPTGVEMEAMTAVSVASLALYDMCKAMHRGIRIRTVELVSKAGGQSGTWRREPEA